ncbi:hypothetical protein Ddye_015189 [Dipteronia dyeriana]|uniref:MEKHLA domain-containing protein n=1 Tax=Dipteronia dyeriana TaxID=168575 RepID=A0AAD9WZB5_9ROSI|nr:hypothetical protein Ddye_015189 [Dipteronia dyeriana]
MMFPLTSSFTTYDLSMVLPGVAGFKLSGKLHNEVMVLVGLSLAYSLIWPLLLICLLSLSCLGVCLVSALSHEDLHTYQQECVSSMGSPVSYEQAVVWKLSSDDDSNHCMAFIFINLSFVR